MEPSLSNIVIGDKLAWPRARAASEQLSYRPPQRGVLLPQVKAHEKLKYQQALVCLGMGQTKSENIWHTNFSYRKLPTQTTVAL